MSNLSNEEWRTLCAILRATACFSAARVELLLDRLESACLKANFNPNQPRVPAGNPDGGQWTDGGAGASTSTDTPAPRRREHTVERDRSGRQPWERVVNEFAVDGSLAQQTVFNRDGSAIRSEFRPQYGAGWDERHRVRLADGQIVTFERSGAAQIVRDENGQTVGASVWTDNGPEPQAVVQPTAFAPALPLIGPAVGAAASATIAAGAALYNWFSTQNSADQTAVLAFRAEEFRPDRAGIGTATWVGQLSRGETQRACPQLSDVQSRTDRIASEISRSEYPDPAKYGTAVHKRLESEIRALGDANLRAEVSLLKTKDETGRPPRYGRSDTVRVDVLEKTRRGTVCVYGRRGLTAGRVLEIMSAAYLFDPAAKSVIVIEIRPGT